MFAIRKDRVSFTGLAKGASVLALGFATSAVAQTTTTQDPAASTPREARANVDDGIDIVVTATRQEQVLSRVPGSVSAFSQTNMDQTGVKSFEDLARFTPRSEEQTSELPSLMRKSSAVFCLKNKQHRYYTNTTQ